MRLTGCGRRLQPGTEVAAQERAPPSVTQGHVWLSSPVPAAAEAAGRGAGPAESGRATRCAATFRVPSGTLCRGRTRWPLKSESAQRGRVLPLEGALRPAAGASSVPLGEGDRRPGGFRVPCNSHSSSVLTCHSLLSTGPRDLENREHKTPGSKTPGC